MNLCVQDVAERVGGTLALGLMPPLAGEWTAVGRIAFAASDVRPGDLLWCLDGGRCDEELAYFRGAAGVVTTRPIEPWPGRYAICVADAAEALARLTAGKAAEESFIEETELKDLQLPAVGGTAIFPPTCGRLIETSDRRPSCRRAA